MTMKKNILILGSDGFIGENLYETLLSSHNLFTLSPSENNRKLAVSKHIKSKLSNIDLIENIIIKNNIDIVIHLVSTLIPSSGQDLYEREIFEVINPTFKLIDFVSDRKIKIIYMSSGGAIYGRSFNREVVTENSDKQPITYYGLSKLLIENYLLFKARVSNLDYITLRPSNVYGPRQQANRPQGLIAHIINSVASKNNLDVYGDGESVRDYIHVKDVCSVVKILIDKDISNESFNLSSGESFSVNKVIEMASSSYGYKVPVNYIEARGSDVKDMVFDNSKISKFYGFKFISLDEGMFKNNVH